MAWQFKSVIITKKINKLTQYVSVPARVAIHGHGVGVVCRDDDERVARVRHFQGGFDGFVHLKRLCQGLLGLVSVVAMVNEASCQDTPFLVVYHTYK